MFLSRFLQIWADLSKSHQSSADLSRSLTLEPNHKYSSQVGMLSRDVERSSHALKGRSQIIGFAATMQENTAKTAGSPRWSRAGCKICCGIRPCQIQLRVHGDFQAKSSSRTEVYWRTGPALHSQSSSLEPLMTSKVNREIRQAPLLRNWNKIKVSSDNWSKAEINASFHITVSILDHFETFQFKLFLIL